MCCTPPNHHTSQALGFREQHKIYPFQLSRLHNKTPQRHNASRWHYKKFRVQEPIGTYLQQNSPHTPQAAKTLLKPIHTFPPDCCSGTSFRFPNHHSRGLLVPFGCFCLFHSGPVGYRRYRDRPCRSEQDHRKLYLV